MREERTQKNEETLNLTSLNCITAFLLRVYELLNSTGGLRTKCIYELGSIM